LTDQAKKPYDRIIYEYKKNVKEKSVRDCRKRIFCKNQIPGKDNFFKLINIIIN